MRLAARCAAPAARPPQRPVASVEVPAWRGPGAPRPGDHHGRGSRRGARPPRPPSPRLGRCRRSGARRRLLRSTSSRRSRRPPHRSRPGRGRRGRRGLRLRGWRSSAVRRTVGVDAAVGCPWSAVIGPRRCPRSEQRFPVEAYWSGSATIARHRSERGALGRSRRHPGAVVRPGIGPVCSGVRAVVRSRVGAVVGTGIRVP